MIRTLLGAALAAAVAAPLSAAEFSPAIVYDMGGMFDKSFNEGVHNGAMKFRQDTGVEFHDVEIRNDSQRESTLRDLAQRGADPILAAGYTQAAAVEKVARGFPDTRFTIIDSVVDLPNVQSIMFKDHEGSFVVGVLAAMASKSGEVGFVGGMDIPPIRRFACGYVQGVRHANAGARIYQSMTGDTADAWSDPVRGSELAKNQFDRGADVVFHAAGGTGIGVLQAAADAGKLGIGVDSNQNHLHPGNVLTSMLKRVDVATQRTFEDAREGTWRPGLSVLGLKEGGVGWALDENNAPLITPEMKAAAEKATQDIIAGTITVHDYMADGACPDA